MSKEKSNKLWKCYIQNFGCVDCIHKDLCNNYIYLAEQRKEIKLTENALFKCHNENIDLQKEIENIKQQRDNFVAERNKVIDLQDKEIEKLRKENKEFKVFFEDIIKNSVYATLLCGDITKLKAKLKREKR